MEEYSSCGEQKRGLCVALPLHLRQHTMLSIALTICQTGFPSKKQLHALFGTN